MSMPNYALKKKRNYLFLLTLYLKLGDLRIREVPLFIIIHNNNTIEDNIRILLVDYKFVMCWGSLNVNTQTDNDGSRNAW